MTLRPAPSLMNEHVASDPEAVFVKVTLIKSLRLVGGDGEGGEGRKREREQTGGCGQGGVEENVYGKSVEYLYKI